MWQIPMQEIEQEKSFGMYLFKELSMGMIMLKLLWIMMCHVHKLFLVMKSVYLHLATQGLVVGLVCTFIWQHNEKLMLHSTMKRHYAFHINNDINDTTQSRLCI